MRRSLTITAVAVAMLLAAALLWDAAGPDPSPPLDLAGGAAADAAGAPLHDAAAAAVAGARAVAALPGDRQEQDTEAPLPFAAERTGYCGRVLAPGGAVVPGIEVRLFRGAADIALPVGFDVFAREPAAPQLLAARTLTSADGRFSLDGVLPRGLCFLRLDFPDLRQVPPAWRRGQGTVAPVQRTPAPGEVVDLGDLWLKTGAVLTGRVVGDDGRAVAGALVRAAILPPLPFAAIPIERLQPDGAVIVTAGGRSGVLEVPPWLAEVMAALPIGSTTTAGDGTFTLDGVDPGDLVLAVTAAGRASLLRQGVHADAGAIVNLGELLLPDGCVASVTVRGTDGKPVAGAEVVVAPCSVGVPAHIGQRAGSTDAEGRVEQPGLPRGRALAAARRSAREPWCIGEPGPADGNLLVELPAVYSLTLTVLDPAGQPPRDLQLKLVEGASNARVVEFSLFGLLRGIDLRRRLRRLDDGSLRIDDLAAGSWCAVVGAPGCATQCVDLELRQDTARSIQLRPARQLAVRVLDAAGAPVADAAIHLLPRGGSRSQRIVDLPLVAGRTGRDGGCLLRDLPTDETRVTAVHPRHGQVHAVVQGAPPELLLQFAAAGSIQGRLTDGGRAPQPGRWLVVLERRQDGAIRGAVPDLPQLMLPDLDGQFTFAALQPGSYRLTAQDSLTDVGSVGGLIQYQARRKQIFPWNKAEVELHGGEVLEVRLDAMLDAAPYAGPGAEITGTVEIDGMPGAGALVVGTSTQPERRVTSRVDASGSFDLGRCPTGKLRVVVVPREVAESRLLEHLFSHHFARDIAVADGVPQVLRIDVRTGSVRGQVRDWNGVPVDDCRVVLFDRGGDGRSSALRVARTDGGGNFAFPQLPAGAFDLQAQKDGHGRAAPAKVQVQAGAQVDALAITLLATARVSGRVEVMALPRRGPLGILLHPLAGGEMVRGGGKADGSFELQNVPAGGYRAEVQVWGDARTFPAGEVEVIAPATAGVVLTPRLP